MWINKLKQHLNYKKGHRIVILECSTDRICERKKIDNQWIIIKKHERQICEERIMNCNAKRGNKDVKSRYTTNKDTLIHWTSNIPLWTEIAFHIFVLHVEIRTFANTLCSRVSLFACE